MSVTRAELVALGAQTASGVSQRVGIPSGRDVTVVVNTTAGSSVTDFDVWLQASDDGDTWYDYPADYTIKSSSTAANSPSADTLLIVSSKSTTTAEQFLGVYKSVGAAWIRLRWAFTGTSITFEAAASVK